MGQLIMCYSTCPYGCWKLQITWILSVTCTLLSSICWSYTKWLYFYSLLEMILTLLFSVSTLFCLYSCHIIILASHFSGCSHLYFYRMLPFLMSLFIYIYPFLLLWTKVLKNGSGRRNHSWDDAFLAHNSLKVVVGLIRDVSFLDFYPTLEKW